jgi:AbiV family abortive infection protein
MENYDSVRKNCLDNANELLGAARQLKGSRLERVMFHLGIAAMEELGKVMMLRIRHILDKEKPDDTFNPRIDDHVKKLFWALWFPAFSKETPDPKDMLQHEGMAQMLYGKKLRYLYADVDIAELEKPTPEEVETLLSMTEALLGRESSIELKEPTPEEREMLRWFLSAQDQPELRRHIFSKSIFNKIGELGGLLPWIKWLYSEHKKNQEEMSKISLLELARVPDDGSQYEPKWSLKIRLITDSHSVRSGVLSAANKKIDRIKMHSIGKKDSFDFEALLPKAITLNRLWDWGLYYTQTYVMALNVATHGRFWHELPKHRVNYFDSLKDLERPHLGVNPPRTHATFSWGSNVLEEKNLVLAARVFGYFLDQAQIPDFFEATKLYGEGLMLYCKVDVQARFESNALASFYKSMRVIARLNGWDGSGDPKRAIIDLLLKHLSTIERLPELLTVAEELELKGQADYGVTFEDATLMKAYNEACLLLGLNDFEQKRLEEFKKEHPEEFERNVTQGDMKEDDDSSPLGNSL